MDSGKIADALVSAVMDLRVAVDSMQFTRPVTHAYNPLVYAWQAHERYLRRFANSFKKVVFLGMNPGPYGMVQTGVPFGEISAVRDWMRIETAIGKPACEHPRRPVQGFACQRSEVSGRRLWGLFAGRFGRAEGFIARHFVANYCPLAFLDEAGRNLTPDKLPASEAKPLFSACDQHLRKVIEILKPHWVVGIGDFAEKRARIALEYLPLKIGKILHPSPASPAANRDWGSQATKQLEALGIWAV